MGQQGGSGPPESRRGCVSRLRHCVDGGFLILYDWQLCPHDHADRYMIYNYPAAFSGKHERVGDPAFFEQ